MIICSQASTILQRLLFVDMANYCNFLSFKMFVIVYLKVHAL